MLADSAWSIGWKEGPGHSNGTHGYDNRNSDIYPILAHLLDLQPAIIDGILENVQALLRP